MLQNDWLLLLMGMLLTLLGLYGVGFWLRWIRRGERIRGRVIFSKRGEKPTPGIAEAEISDEEQNCYTVKWGVAFYFRNTHLWLRRDHQRAYAVREIWARGILGALMLSSGLWVVIPMVEKLF